MGPVPRISYRKVPSIKDLIVRSHFQQTEKQNNWLECQQMEFRRCNNCKACKIGINKKSFRDPEGNLIEIKKKITCTTTFVIYAIQCNCGAMYIGSTVCMLEKRILEHIRAVKNQDLSYATAKPMWKCQKGN